MKLKNKLISYTVFILLSLSLSGCIFDSDKWYDYGNGKINLKNINFIKPVLQSTLTLAEDNLEEIGKDYSEPLTEESVSKYKKMLGKEKNIPNSDFYAIKIHTSVMFDAFRLDLFESDFYVKRPTQYTINDFLIKKAKEQGVPDGVFEKLKMDSKGQTFDRNGFIKFLGDNGLNLDNYWVKNSAINMGLGERGYKFVSRFGSDAKESEKVASEVSISELNDRLEKSLKSYKNIPAN